MIGKFEVRRVTDSFECLKVMRVGSMDVTITDPPYTAHVHKNMRSGYRQIGKKYTVPVLKLKFPHVEGYGFTRDIVNATSRWSLIFCPLESFGEIKTTLGDDYVRGGVWIKPNSMGQLTGDRPACAFEGVAVAHPKALKKAWNGHGSYALWSANSTRGTKPRHPNQKPHELALKLVALFSNCGDTIFDPFCGSAAIGRAAIMLGRNYVGWDFDQTWVDHALVSLASVNETMAVTDEHALTLCKPWGTRKNDTSKSTGSRPRNSRVNRKNRGSRQALLSERAEG